MESLNLHKGYDKVVDHDQPPPTIQPPPRHRLTRLIAISLTFLLTLVILSLIVSLIHETRTESPDTISTVCSVTRYPSSCFASVHNLSLSKPSPEQIFTLSLQASLSELRNLTSLPKDLIAKSNDKGTESALRDCVDLFDDAASQLGDSTRAVEGGLRSEKVGDLNTWISAAMTDQETCVDGLEEMGSTVVDEVRVRLQRSKEYMSNSLAILANMNALLQKFHLGNIH